MDGAPPPRVQIVVPVRTLLTLLAVGVVVALAILSLGTLLSIFVAAVLALGLDPVVGRMVVRGWGRGRASVAVFGALFAAVVAIVLVTAGPVWDEIQDFVKALPAYWEHITNLPAFKDAASSSGAPDKVQEWLKDLVAALPDAASALLGAAGGVFGTILSLVTLTFLALFLLMERPTITNWLFGFTAPAVEARWRPVVENSVSAVSSSLISTFAVSIIAGLVAGLSAWAFGLPFPLVLAVITAVVDITPQVGGRVAAVSPVGVALTVSTEAAIAILIIQLVYQQVENYIVYPVV